MPGIDLHTHTVYSDGTLTPLELIALARDRGVAVIGLTDHDTTDGLDEATTAGSELGVEVVPGVEFSTVRDEEGMHVLCYYVDLTDPELLAELRRLQEDRSLLRYIGRYVFLCGRESCRLSREGDTSGSSVVPGSVVRWRRRYPDSSSIRDSWSGDLRFHRLYLSN